ncbi:MAG TPA: TrmH family RNA methyltransferase [Myxococcota bacterium]|nr:TrmH family RNA methyltransferase [Myxococcota bacterium]
MPSRVPHAPPRTRQLAGPAAIEAALASGETVRVLLVRDGELPPDAAAVVERARGKGIEVRVSSAAALWRLSMTKPASDVLALVGRDPRASLDETLAAPEPVWLLAGIAYPGNAGFAVRTAEVSGAAGIVIDARFDRPARREAVRASMRADWFMPVFFERALPVVERARAAGRRILAIEDVGQRAPWEVDLVRPALFVVGGERYGIAPEILARCDEVLRIPTAGFIPSYNLQAAMAAVAIERLRQETRRRRAGAEGVDAK